MKDYYDGDYVPRKSHLEEPKEEDLRIKELAEAQGYFDFEEN